MASNTPNYNFDLREGTDIFNPLSSNANWESLDTLLKTIQETGGITTYTTTASANLLKLSGTPVANDTVFKFVAAGNANTWTAATGGVVNNIVGLDGVQMTIQGGNMYVAWINSANSMVCMVWPEVVNAQTFDGKGPAEWATKVQLDAVNQTAGNATQTAQAAATVANQALEAAQKAGITLTKLWETDTSGVLAGSANASEFSVNLSEEINDGDILKIYAGYATSGTTSGATLAGIADVVCIEFMYLSKFNKRSVMVITPEEGYSGRAYVDALGGRQYTFGTKTVTFGIAFDGNASTFARFHAIPLAIYKYTPKYN